jgi:tryptophanyl-tRNA synthetase
MSIKKTLLSGIQPTGKMHLGNYLGAVSNWVTLQDSFDAYFMIADLHALTSVYENPTQLAQDKLALAVDLLSAGIDPSRATLYFQSDVPEHAELHLILSMMTPLPWLERVPSYKGKLDEIKDKDLNTYGFLGYPLLQSADILLFKTNVVPVGEDQLPHIELTREIARRFNHLTHTSFFPEPQAMLTHYPALLGLDGRKMSKSYGNTIPLSASEADMTALILKMITDPNRKLLKDPGDPSKCPVFSYHSIYSPPTRQAEISTLCQTAGIGCVACKRDLADRVLDSLAHYRARKRHFDSDLGEVTSLLKAGATKARETASHTLGEVKRVMGLG